MIWSARVYAQKRYSVARAACAHNVDSWQAHRAFIRQSASANCVHSSRAAAELYQKAYLALLERKQIALCTTGIVCDFENADGSSSRVAFTAASAAPGAIAAFAGVAFTAVPISPGRATADARRHRSRRTSRR